MFLGYRTLSTRFCRSPNKNYVGYCGYYPKDKHKLASTLEVLTSKDTRFKVSG